MFNNMFGLLYLILVIVVFAYLAHILAKRKGLNPVFWGAMGAFFGPLALPFILLAKPRNNPPKQG